MNFESDNSSGICPEVFEALSRVNGGAVQSYGADPTTLGLTKLFSEHFERDVVVYPVVTGTAANALSLAMVTPPHGSVLCHRLSHIAEHECGAAEFYSGGRLLLLDGPGTKFTPETIKEEISKIWLDNEHMVQPAVLSLTQATEFGTVYSVDEIEALCRTAHEFDLKVHMDGARFANALVHLGCSPADMTWRAGVDILSFGTTKNGTMAAEAVVFFDAEPSKDFKYRRKRGGHLISKMRFLSAQLEAYLQDDVWRRNAECANRLAARLGQGLAALEGIRLECPVEANFVFAWMPNALAEALRAEGFLFHSLAFDGDRSMARLATAFSTDPGHVDQFVASATRLSERLD